MFGINKLQSGVDELASRLLSLEELIDINTKAQEKACERSVQTLKYCQDTKIDISSMKVIAMDISMSYQRLEKDFKTFKLLIDQLAEQNVIDKNLVNSNLNFMNDKLTSIFEFLKTIEPVLSNLETVTIDLVPIKKIPKLPKTKTATIDNIN